jgi:hypothetical protein
MQNLDSIKFTSLQLVSSLIIFFNVILFYWTLPIDDRLYNDAYNQTNNDPLRGTTRLTIILSKHNLSQTLWGENSYTSLSIKMYL